MKNFNTLFLLTLIIIVGIGMYFIFKPFLIAIFVAFILSQLFKSWYIKLLKIFKKPSLTAMVSTSLIFLIIFLPLIFIGKLAITELISSYQTVVSGNFQETTLSLRNDFLTRLNNYPLLSQKINSASMFSENNLSTLSQNVGNSLTIMAKYIYQGTSHFLFTLFIIFFCLYYFFKDGDRLINKIINLSPLKNSQEEKLLDNFIAISRATLRGSLIIAIIQGTLTAILFLATGVSSAILLGVIATIFALIPMVGTAVVWLPVGIIMLLLGYTWQGIVILVVGSLIIGSIDNILRPQLVGNKTSLHPLLVFLSTIGGISFFGIAGFLLGPVTAVLFLNLLAIYQSEFKKDLEKFNA